MRLYNILIPTVKKLPVIADLPHSGTYIPPKVRKQFHRDPATCLPNLDWHLEKLYDFLPDLGITVMQATHSRYVVNLNRSLRPPLFGPEKSSIVPRHDTRGSIFYEGGLMESEIEERINKYYLPYHRRLTGIVSQLVKEFNQAYLIDLHSFILGPVADICLGDVNGTTCSEKMIGCFEEALQKHEFSVVKNDMWTGGYITRHYASIKNIETLQIELKFPAYLEGEEYTEKEITEWNSARFRNARQRLKKAFGEVMNCLFDVN